MTPVMTLEPTPIIAVQEEPLVEPDESQLITEDNTPVDSIFAEKQMRLLTESLHSSWPGPDGKNLYVAMANVCLFYNPKVPPLVPDMLLSLGVTYPENIRLKQNHSYFVWNYSKPPDVVIEIVSNRVGGEATTKFETYAKIGVAFYVIFDPEHHLSDDTLRIFYRNGSSYKPMDGMWFPSVSLGLTLWHGEYERGEDIWLRWCDQNGQVIPSGAEASELERQRANAETQRAESEKQRAESEKQRADTETQRAENEKQRADTETQRAENEKLRADQFLILLRQHGIELPVEKL